MLKATLICTVSLVVQAQGVSAGDVCVMKALRDVPSLEDPTSMVKAGSTQGSVTVYRYDKNTKAFSFCQHGGYCYPESVILDQKKVVAFKLINCNVDRSHPHDDKDETDYELIPNRAVIRPEIMRESDVGDQLQRMGLCSACAANIAAFYVRKPTSECARVARAALEGDPTAISKLSDLESSPTCRFWR